MIQQVDASTQPYNITGNELVLEFSPGGSVAAPTHRAGSGGGDGSDG